MCFSMKNDLNTLDITCLEYLRSQVLSYIKVSSSRGSGTTVIRTHRKVKPRKTYFYLGNMKFPSRLGLGTL